MRLEHSVSHVQRVVAMGRVKVVAVKDPDSARHSCRHLVEEFNERGLALGVWSAVATTYRGRAPGAL